MIRLIVWLIVLIGISIAACWLADHPGEVTLLWLDYRIDTSLAFLVLVTVFMTLTVTATYSSFAFWKARRQHRAFKRQAAGLKVLTKAYAALALGNLAEAEQWNKRAMKSFKGVAIVHLLSAQIAKLKGDDAGAEAQLEGLLTYGETELLALRGLTERARKKGKSSEALGYAERGRRLKPDDPWMLQTLMDIYTTQGRWQEALQIIDKAPAKAISHDTATRYRSIIHFLHGKKLEAGENPELALRFLEKAHDLMPGFAPATTAFAKALQRERRVEDALKALQRAWKHAPHPAFGSILMEISSKIPLDKQMKRAQRWLALHPETPESYLLMARAALLAGDISTAQHHAHLALGKRETVGACLLLSQIAKQDGNKDETSRWATRAANALPDDSWCCQECGMVHTEWALHCSTCQSFDSLTWTTPATGWKMVTAAL